jgi:hypothetical protein
MGHPDGAHTHGSGSGGAGTAVLVVLAAARGEARRAGTQRSLRACPDGPHSRRGYRGCRRRWPGGPAHVAVAPHAYRRGPRHAPRSGSRVPAPRSGAGRSTAPRAAARARAPARGAPASAWGHPRGHRGHPRPGEPATRPEVNRLRLTRVSTDSRDPPPPPPAAFGGSQHGPVPHRGRICRPRLSGTLRPCKACGKPR